MFDDLDNLSRVGNAPQPITQRNPSPHSSSLVAYPQSGNGDLEFVDNAETGSGNSNVLQLSSIEPRAGADFGDAEAKGSEQGGPTSFPREKGQASKGLADKDNGIGTSHLKNDRGEQSIESETSSSRNGKQRLKGAKRYVFFPCTHPLAPLPSFRHRD